MLYLKDQGVTQPVISALLQAKGAARPRPHRESSALLRRPNMRRQVAVQQPALNSSASTCPGPRPRRVTPAYFPRSTGAFSHMGRCGRHDVLASRPSPRRQSNWRPYYDMGKWVQNGQWDLFWQWITPWGDIPFHYGRWVRNPWHGLALGTDYTWGPSWVVLASCGSGRGRRLGAFAGGAVFVGRLEDFLCSIGVRVGADFEVWSRRRRLHVVVDFDHFHGRVFRMRRARMGHHIGRERMHGFYGRSVARNRVSQG